VACVFAQRLEVVQGVDTVEPAGVNQTHVRPPV
jgi:hypothetical protein